MEFTNLKTKDVEGGGETREASVVEGSSGPAVGIVPGSQDGFSVPAPIRSRSVGGDSESDSSTRSRSRTRVRRTQSDRRTGGGSARPGPKFTRSLARKSRSGTEATIGLKPVVVSVQRLSTPIDVAAVTASRGPSPTMSVRSTRSAASDVECVEEDGGSVAATISPALSSVSLPSLGGAALRRRGRPPTTGDYVGLAAAKKAAVEAEKEALALRTLKARLEGSGVSASSGDSLPRPDDLATEAREQPTVDLGASIIEEMELVDRMATTSNNLKGTYVRNLRIAARKVTSYTSELVKRTSSTAEHPAAVEEVRRLRARVGTLEAELASLRAELAALKSEKGRDSPKPRPRRNVRPRLSSSDEDLGAEGRDEFFSGISPIRTTLPTPPMAERRAPLPPPPPTPSLEERLMAKMAGFMEEKLSAFVNALNLPQMNPAPSRIPAVGPPPPIAGNARGKKEGVAKATPDLASFPALPQPRPVQNKWTVVEKKSRKKKKKGGAAPPVPPSSRVPPPSAVKPAAKEAPKKAKPSRPPTTAAVALTIPPSAKITYAEAMVKARTAFKPEDLGIAEVRPRQSITGGLLLEIPGEGRAEKAATLAARLNEVMAGTGVRIAQPTKRAEMRVRGLEQSITPEEVAAAVAAAGNCLLGEVKTGVIRSSPTGRGLGSLWVQCPLVAARKITSSGRLKVGWGPVPVEFLPPRPLQCFKCLEKGHVRNTCRCPVDRSGLCYRCGAPGHVANGCTATPHCALCEAKGRPANHRVGGAACLRAPTRGKKKGGAGEKAPLPIPAPRSAAKTASSTPLLVVDLPPTPVGDETADKADGKNGLEEPMDTAK